MNKVIRIKDILKHLSEENLYYTFRGNKNDFINGFSTLFNYKHETITFISTLNNFKDYKHLFHSKSIRLIIIDPSEKNYDCFENVIQIEKPKNAFFKILETFFNSKTDELNFTYTNQKEGLKHHTFISEHARIGKNVKFGYGCIIEADVQIGDNTIIHHNVVIKNGTKIGKNCVIHSGTVIGEQGFNPLTMNDGKRKMVKHFGGVKIGDSVYIGSNCNIHKGAIEDTIIKEGVKLNTMVHVAHNCVIGEHTVVTMPTHICGSVKIGRKCHIAATTIRNQCTIGDNVVLGLGSVVVKNVDAGKTMVGNPARPLVK